MKKVNKNLYFLNDVYHWMINDFPEVLIDATSVGGSGWMRRQSIKPYIGMKCCFVLNEGTTHGFNFEITPHFYGSKQI